jgi:hypothetical protein
MSKSFNGTNIKTGFFKWIENNPVILLDFSKKVNGSIEFLKPAIEYGFFKKIYQISEIGYLIPLQNSVKNTKNFQFDHLFKYAERLGGWMGQVNSTKTIYNHLGIQI